MDSTDYRLGSRPVTRQTIEDVSEALSAISRLWLDVSLAYNLGDPEYKQAIDNADAARIESNWIARKLGEQY